VEAGEVDGKVEAGSAATATAATATATATAATATAVNCDFMERIITFKINNSLSDLINITLLQTVLFNIPLAVLQKTACC
jgi:ABC-type uncharacterized transport system permease subunit